MDFFSRSVGAIAPPPKLQMPEDTILKLCDRLEHASLLEDRRAAVLALRSLAHDYREVQSHSLLLGPLFDIFSSVIDPEAIGFTTTNV